MVLQFGVGGRAGLFFGRGRWGRLLLLLLLNAVVEFFGEAVCKSVYKVGLLILGLR